jgi:hypothetical protein
MAPNNAPAHLPQSHRSSQAGISKGSSQAPSPRRRIVAIPQSGLQAKLLNNVTLLHHEVNALERSDIFERVAVHPHHIGEASR